LLYPKSFIIEKNKPASLWLQKAFLSIKFFLYSFSTNLGLFEICALIPSNTPTERGLLAK
jgi:hypothetical protein